MPKPSYISKASCVTWDEKKAIEADGAINYFDVKPQDYTSGNLTGLELVGELATLAAQSSESCHLGIVEIIAAAVHIRSQRDNKEFSNRGAAVGFIVNFEELFVQMCKNFDFVPFFEEVSAAHAEALDLEVKQLKTKSAAFLARLKTGNFGDGRK
ncbi:hypothetical protein PSQ40_04990 [Curvibacter sp. HBC61]|uniref:Uncharacterized protein n=1 Tax=Curvibacter cyanobacteriorum TaxID=3026422 RepID=A0ABT5MYR9_9BURK|nr:hypothetical protein [Curvibacter sp. HBC61]MDD0837922.1 hypothetical protein [Curvibacter sp. HBC61]